MAFTRFHDDSCRIIKANQQSTGPGRWALDVPGNGDKPCFFLDPQIIPQKWGGNLWSNSTDVQSSLLGIDKKLTRDCIGKHERVELPKSEPRHYPVCNKLTTEQSRAIMPAWTARDLEQNHAYYLPENPQAHTTMPFKNNMSTRILEKDHFKRTMDCVPANNQGYTTVPVIPQKGTYIGGPITCRNACNRL
jgi:hypothetical protein